MDVSTSQTLLVLLFSLPVLGVVVLAFYYRRRALEAERHNELNEKARAANPPNSPPQRQEEEPSIVLGSGREHPDGGLFFKLTDGTYGTLRDDGTLYTVPKEMYDAGKPVLPDEPSHPDDGLH